MHIKITKSITKAQKYDLSFISIPFQASLI